MILSYFEQLNLDGGNKTLSKPDLLETRLPFDISDELFNQHLGPSEIPKD